MGTFRILPTSQLSGGTPFIHNADPVPPDFAGWVLDDTASNVFECLNNSTGCTWDVFTDPSPTNGLTSTVRFDFSGASIYLDGSLIPITFAGLPAGFKALTASVIAVVPQNNQPAFGIGFSRFFIQQDNANNGPVNTVPGTLSYPYVFPGDPFNPTISQIYTNGCGFKVICSVGTVFDSVSGGVTELYVNGTYEIEQFQFQLPVITSTDELVEEGSPIVIASVPLLPEPPPPDPPTDDPEVINLLGVTAINLNFLCAGVPTTVVIPSSLFTVWTWYDIEFLLPNLVCNPSVIDIELVGDGTQFSGTVPLRSILTIFFTDGTGIYTLVPGKTDDTLYVQDYTPVTTVDVKIPDPFIKTGFIGG